MTKHKVQIRLAALLLALSSTNVILAAGISNENKHNRPGNTVSNADHAGHVNGNINFTVNAKTNSSNKQQQFISDAQNLQRMDVLRRQLQADHLEAYKRYMQNRKQQSSVTKDLPPDVRARREEYFKHMSERRELINKMMDERRKAAEKRRQVTLQKMHQTSTTPVTTGKT